MISSVSQSSYLPLSSVSNSSMSGIAGTNAHDSLASQATVPVVDRSKSHSTQSLQPNPNGPTNRSSSENSALNPNDATQPVDAPQSTTQMSPEAQQVISQLKARDSEVRAHEQAHIATAGPYATGGISYVYQVGPDGRRYAIGGSVGIDVSPVAGDPEATLAKAQVVQSAALAPAQPSTQDLRVASAAVQMANEARSEISQQSAESVEQQTTDEATDQADQTNETMAPMPEAAGLSALQTNEKSNNTGNLGADLNSDSNTIGGPFMFDRNGFDLRMQLQPLQ